MRNFRLLCCSRNGSDDGGDDDDISLSLSHQPSKHARTNSHERSTFLEGREREEQMQRGTHTTTRAHTMNKMLLEHLKS